MSFISLIRPKPASPSLTIAHLASSSVNRPHPAVGQTVGFTLILRDYLDPESVLVCRTEWSCPMAMCAHALKSTVSFAMASLIIGIL